PSTNGFPTTKPSPLSKFPPQSASRANGTASSVAAAKIDQLLRKERIIAPSWPDLTPNDPNFKPAVEAYWRASKEYRNKVRACLIRAGLFDDPDKPKKLSEAIDFNGICEDMCPDFEKANRIYERNVMGAETVVGPDGQSYPAPHKMIKAFARSAAGQDAPLPMDVRSPAALTRTLDYLFRTVLGDEEENLPKVHPFLWDRTREIRRDFVFQQASINTSELPDQIYCLEHITRFHVMALHQMSRQGVEPAEEFIEQQEREQLGKTLLSLMQTYDDCEIQGVDCKNEAEFRSYYALLNSDSPGILQTVQNWGWKYWGESDQIRTAITLVEALQNTWDTRGPLKPQATTDVAQNAFSRFFTIVADKKVSYTMACFAEIHFNSVRKSILKTILASYRKQRDQTKDWTLSKLNEYLRFDDEGDIISFAEAYGLRFDDIDGEECLSFESEGVSDPFPPLKQNHSYDLVERKRGYHSLLEVIYSTVYDEEEEKIQESVEESAQRTKPANVPTTTTGSSSGQEAHETAVQEGTMTPGSLFDSITQPKTFNNDFFNLKPAEKPPAAQPSSPLFFPKAPETSVEGAPLVAKQPDSPFSFTKNLETSPFTQQSDPSSAFSKQPAKEPPSVSKPSTSTQPSSLLNFGQPPSTTPTENNLQEPLSLGKYAVSAAPPETSVPPPSFFGQQPVAVSEPSNRPTFPTSQSPLPQASLFNKSPTPAFPPLQQNAASVLPQPETPNFLQNNFQGVSGQSQMNPTNWSNQPRNLNREARLDRLANWIALGDDGLLEHFTQLTVENLLKETVELFQKDEYEKAIRKADELARKEADQFRQYFLSTKYLNKWRQGARQLRQKRVGRENRQAMREMAESMRASKAAQSANIVEDFRASARASTGGSRRGSLESLLGATDILSGVHDSQRQIRAIVQNEDESTVQKSQQSERPFKKPIKRHQRGKSDVPLRRSLMSDSSYLNGGSRIHLMSTYDAKDENRRQVSGVHTDYFRLKARGITTLPGGTPVPTSAAKEFLRHKRSFDGISKQSTPQRPSHYSIPRSVPSRYSTEAGQRETTLEPDENIRDLKERTRAGILDDSQTRQKRSFDDNDDEALFERAKRVREQMDEGSEWYRQQVERHSRSVS
ncbi:SAC3 family protein, partial [Lachnellula subtilissima]